MRILFIGGTRSVGLFAARTLAGQGHEVAVFHRGEHAGDLPESVRRFRSPAAAMPVRAIPDELRAYEPELVVHMIAMDEQAMLAAVGAFSGILGASSLPAAATSTAPSASSTVSRRGRWSRFHSPRTHP